MIISVFVFVSIHSLVCLLWFNTSHQHNTTHLHTHTYRLCYFKYATRARVKHKKSKKKKLQFINIFLLRAMQISYRQTEIVLRAFFSFLMFIEYFLATIRPRAINLFMTYLVVHFSFALLREEQIWVVADVDLLSLR